MTKKILAMFLAVLMVVSVLPASVLAADSDCPIAKGKHNLDNCTDYTEKKVVAATCTAGGYTLYECSACGDTFMGTPTAKLEHEESSVVEAAKDPTFTEPGNVTKYHCDICDEDWYESEPHTIAPYDKDAADELFDCDEGGKCAFEWENEDKACATGGMVATCVKCGFQIVSKAAHTIDYTQTVIVKEPTATENGEAKAPCTVCGEKATIVIYPNHDHVYEDDSTDTLKVVEEAYDCVTGGYIEHLQCVICDKLFLEEEGVLVEKTLDELKGEPVESGEHTVGTLKAESDDGETESEEVTCTSDGVKIYDCSVCNKEIIETVPAGHAWVEDEIVAMDCGQDGIVKKTCSRCDLVTTVTETAPKHTTLEEYQAAFNAIGKEIDAEALEALEETEIHLNCYVFADGENTGFLKPVANTATCTAKGEYSWNCLNCGRPQKTASAKLGHNIASFTVPATCAAYAYTFEYCTNAGCPTYAATSVVKDEDGAEYKAYVETQIEVIEAVKNDDDEIIGYAKVMKDVTISAPAVKGEIVEFGKTYDADAHRFGLETKVEPTCELAGNYYKKCADCGYEEKSTPAALGHEWVTSMTYSDADKRPDKVDSTCSVKGSITYTCKRCDETDVVELDLVTDLQYTDLAEAQAAHYNAETEKGLVFDKHQEGSCTQFGYDAYKCEACNHTVIVSDGLTGTGHSDSKVFTIDAIGETELYNFNNGGYRITITAVSGEETVSSGKLPVKITVNGKDIVNFGEEVQVAYAADLKIVLTALHFDNAPDAEVEYSYDSYIVTVKYYTIVDPTCNGPEGEGVDGKIVKHNCINEWCDTDLNTDGAQVYEYAEKKINKLDHDYVTVKEAVTGVCGEIEARAEIVCSVCGDIKDLLKSNGKVDKADYYDGKPVNDVKLGWNIDEAICKNETPLYDIYYCSECETYHIRNYKPVVPHTWDEGVILEGDEPTCSATGTKTYYCTVCGEPKEETIPAVNHENSDEEFFTDHCNDTETNRHCVVCCNRPGKTDCATKKTNGVYDCAGMIGKNHSDTVAKEDEYYNDPSCTAKGYWMVICEYCSEAQVIVDEDSEPAGHEAPAYSTEGMTAAEAILYAEKYTEVGGKAYLSYTEATVTAAGQKVYECAVCGGVITEEIKRLENLHFTLNASNADAPACGEFATFSLVALTVKATGIDATLAGFNMNIIVDGMATFVGYEWAENSPFLGGVTEPKNFEGKINVLGRVIGANEIPVEDETLITLYFRVLGDVSFSFENDKVTAQNAVEEIESSVKGTEIEVCELLDVDGKDADTQEITILNDLQAAINIFMGATEGVTYSAAADINRNGEIDLQDLQLMCKIASIVATIDSEEPNVEVLLELVADLLMLDLYEGEAELYGLCTECKGIEKTHAEDCSKFVKA